MSHMSMTGPYSTVYVARYMCSELEALSTEVSSEPNYDTMRERDHLREHLQNLKYLQGQNAQLIDATADASRLIRCHVHAF